MNISSICIRRPVLSCVISLVLMVIGFLAYHELTTRYFPQYESARLRIMTKYPGASAQLVETNVTTPLENAISGVNGIETIQSTSSQGNSEIELHLKSGADKSDIANQIRDKIAKQQRDLPDEVDTPIVYTGHNDNELLDIAFVDPNRSPQALQDYLDRTLTNNLTNLEGVASVELFGSDAYAMRINLNPNKLRGYKLSIGDVTKAIKENNVELPAGDIRQHDLVLPINAETGLSTAEQFNQIPIKTVNGNIIRIHDIGNAKLGHDSDNPTITKYNGKRSIWLQIDYSTDANPIQTANLVLKTLHQLQSQMPSSIKMHVFYNQATYMKESIFEVYQSIAIAVLCVIAVIVVFLGNLRAALIPIITIPICLLSSFSVMSVFGFSINVISLLALVLSIGLVVDDAIVVLENIHRHIEHGEPPSNAAHLGSRQITFAVLAMTLTLAAVYLPIGFMHGHTAIIFRTFAFTLAGSVIISGFIALTLTPMMCAKLLMPMHHQEHRYQILLQHVFDKLTANYRKVLLFSLQHRTSVIALAAGLAISCVFLFRSVPSEFIPNDDQGMLISIVNTPTWASNQYTNKLAETANNIIKQNPNVADTLSIASNHGSRFNAIITKLKPSKQRTATTTAISEQLNHAFSSIPGLNVHAFAMSFGSNNKAPLAFSILSTGSYQQLYQTSNTILDALRQYPGIQNLQSSVNFDSQQYVVHINHRMAAQLGVSTETIDQTIATLFGGSKVSTFTRDGKNYNVYIKATNQQSKSIDQLKNLSVVSLSGKSIPLNNLVSIHSESMQSSLLHNQRLRAIDFTASINPKFAFGEVINHLQQQLPSLLASNQQYEFSGKALKTIESKNSSSMLFILALVFIYLVLAAQFESFIDPLIILTVVPLCICSALLALKLFGGSRNIYTDIGLVTLIGLIAKHGILITQFANDAVEQGAELAQAVIQAAIMRFRPILMTTAAMVFGAIPLLLSLGNSAASRQQLGIVIISGLLFGTFFSLILIPVVYMGIKSFRIKAITPIKSL